MFRPEEPFTWASGIRSPVYCDNRLTLDFDGRPETTWEEGLAQVIRENYLDAEVLTGTATAGIAHAAITPPILGIPWDTSAPSQGSRQAEQDRRPSEKGQKVVVVKTDLHCREA